MSISLLILHAVHGLREGTMLSMLLVGNLVILYGKIWNKLAGRFHLKV